ncbi:neutral zinc metallopeptidase [Streptomyces sp. NPDC057623]|uniref:neutral zinc metallopeptidase n=1 Tax=Streptomyces sp. NPDC057623 TaxID=3346187 RepID=UPI0036C54774
MLRSRPRLATLLTPAITLLVLGAWGSSAASSDSDGPRLCSLSDRSEGNCSGPERIGVGAIGPVAAQANIPTFTGQPGTATMRGYLTTVLENAANFWSRAYISSGIHDDAGAEATSKAVYVLMEPGETAPDCGGGTTNPSTLSYCSSDDTIRLSIQAVLADWLGQQLPGEESPRPATGEWSAIYTVAHEFAHNVQEELGVWSDMTVRQIELEADCLAGVYMKGSLDLTADIKRQEFQQVVENASLSGDFDVSDPQQHHGTPQERVDAVILGLVAANPAQCQRQYEPSR